MNMTELQAQMNDVFTNNVNAFSTISELSSLLVRAYYSALAGIEVEYKGNVYSGSYMKVISPEYEGLKLPDAFYVKNSSGVKFRIGKGTTTCGGGHGEGSAYAAETTTVNPKFGFSSDYNGVLTIISSEEYFDVCPTEEAHKQEIQKKLDSVFRGFESKFDGSRFNFNNFENAKKEL